MLHSVTLILASFDAVNGARNVRECVDSGGHLGAHIERVTGTRKPALAGVGRYGSVFHAKITRSGHRRI
jgi:hypothetical protein